MKPTLNSIPLLTAALLLAAFAAHAQPTPRPNSELSVLATNRFVVQTNGSLWLHEIVAVNETGSTIYLQLYKTNGIPANGAVPNLYAPVIVPASSQASLLWFSALPVSQGLVACASSTATTLTLAGTGVRWSALYYDKP